jgi:hypothetical protein
LAVYLLPERECHKCSASLKKQWGCSTDTMLPVLIDNEQLTRCPRRPFLENPLWYNAIFQSSAYQEKGMLTEPGTWLDQPAKLIQALQVVSQGASDAQDYKQAAEERRKRAAAAAPTSAPQRRRGPGR